MKTQIAEQEVLVRSLINYKTSPEATDKLLAELQIEDLTPFEISFEIGGIADPVGQIASYIISSIEGALSGVVSQILGSVNSVVQGALGGLNSAISQVSGSISSVVAAVNSISGTVSSALSGLVGQITSAINSVASQVAGSISSIAGTISSGFNSVLGSINSSFNSLSSSINATIRSIASTITSGFASVSSVLGNLASQIAASLSSIGASILSGLNSAFAQVNSAFSQVSQALSSVGQQILQGLNSAFAQVGTALSSLGAQLQGTLSSAFASLTAGFDSLVSGINSALAQVTDAFNKGFAWVTASWNAFASDPIGSIEKAIDSVLKTFGLPTIEQMTKTVNDAIAPITKTLSDSLTWATGAFLDFAKDPSGFITNIINTALKTLGFPTLAQITKAIESQLKNAFSDVTKLLPKELLAFINLGVKVLTWLTTAHSPAPLDNLSTIFATSATVAGQTPTGTTADKADNTLITNPVTPYANRKAIYEAKWGSFNIWSWNPLIDALATMGQSIAGALQTASKDVQSGLTDLGNYLVDQIVSTFNIAEKNPDKKNPFGRFTNILTDTMKNLAIPTVNPNTDLVKAAEAVILGVGAAVGVGEVAEYLGLGIDLIHPFKNMQFRKKFADLFKKIGLGNVTAVIGGSLVAVSLSPILHRYWNSLSQAQLPDTGSLIAMRHRLVFDEATADKTLDTFLQQHGLDATFRKGIIELAYEIPQPANFADAYFRTVAYEGADVTKVLAEINLFFKLHAIKPDARTGFTLSDLDIANKLVYQLPQFRQFRVLAMVGAATSKDLQKVLVAQRMKPEFIQKLSDASILQGQLPYLKMQEAAFVTMVQHGFETGDTLKTLLDKISYPSIFIDPIVASALLKADETVNVLQVSEFDKQYTEGYMTKEDYAKNVDPLFKNATVLKIHKNIADLARTRLEDNRIRTASDRAVSQELAAFAEGGVSQADFETICKASGKTPNEIKALEAARQIITANLVRIANFRTYQVQLAKNVLSPADFVTKCKALPIDQRLINSALIRILTALLPKPRVADVKALIDQAQALLTAPTQVPSTTTPTA